MLLESDGDFLEKEESMDLVFLSNVVPWLSETRKLDLEACDASDGHIQSHNEPQRQLQIHK